MCPPQGLTGSSRKRELYAHKHTHTLIFPSVIAMIIKRLRFIGSILKYVNLSDIDREEKRIQLLTTQRKMSFSQHPTRGLG